MKTTAAAVIASLLSFFIGTALVFAYSEMFTQYFYDPRMVALAHIFTLGWVSLMIVGVLRQLGPIAFGLRLQATTAVGVAVAVWIPALLLMIIGFATQHYTLAGAATCLLLLAVIVITLVFLIGFRGVRREPPHGHLLAALLYFDAAAILGAWMGLAKGYNVPLPAAFHRVLFAHIHLAGAGWAVLMILAVMSRLFPQPHLRHPVQARIRFVSFNVGLIGFTSGLLLNGSWHPIFGFVLAATCLWYATAFIPILREFAQPSDRSTSFLVASWICLGIVALLGMWFAVTSSTSVFQVQLQFVYGFLYLFGWLSLMILGMLYRIVPTHISKLLTARGITNTGVRRAFIGPKTQTIVLTTMLGGLTVSSSGILLSLGSVFRLGWSLWMIGIAVFVGSLCRLGLAIKRVL